jgi:hypothetical protein
MKSCDTIYDTLAAIWHIPRDQAKRRAYRTSLGLETNSSHPEADAALMGWFLYWAPRPKALTFHERYGFAVYGEGFPKAKR